MPDFPRWMQHLGERAAAPDFHRWREMVTAAGGCTHPIRLVGNSATVDTTTGEVLSTYDTADEPTGYLLTSCGNRRASRCESCARVYADDTFHLIRSGLAGGRNVPESVATHPRVFATFTAPSFGPVHTRTLSRDGRTRPCHPRDTGPTCLSRHQEDDPKLGQAVDPNTYDYAGAALWNHHAGELWHVFTVYLRRQLAEHLAVPRSKLNEHLRAEYAKVAEYQSRGLVHFHAVIRLDGPDGPAEHPPFSITADDLADAITSAARATTVTLPTGTLRWGRQLDIRPITTDAGWTDKRVARYIAKYATKGAEAAGTVNRPLRNIRHLDRIRGLTPHARRMIEAGWAESARYPRLRDWAHMLGYGGHFSSKSRHYSTTLTTIRRDRANHRATQARDTAGLPPLPDHTDRFGTWHVIGTGYKTTAEETWAEHIREQKRRAG